MPLTREQVVATFGDPAPHMGNDGRVRATWPASILVTFALPEALPLSFGPGHAVHVSCHRLIAPHLSAAFNEIHEHPEAWADLDDYGGCYQWRAQAGARAVLSRHAWAIAVDVDAKDNPDGATPHMHPTTVEIFGHHGFEWGGSWSQRQVDGMHFEFADLALLRGRT